jgi:hypothetical protein
MKVEELGLLKADIAKPINLFTGAGFSTLAENSSGDKLPVGDRLKTLLIKEFKLSAYESLDLAGLYAVMLADRREELRSFLESIFTVRNFDERYDALRKLNIEFLYTTNIDDLPYHIFDARLGEQTRVLHDITMYGAPRQASDVMQFVPLHGNVRHSDDDFLFTPGQISSAFASDRETWYIFQREMQARPTFFLGYGLRDAGVLQALHDGSARSNFNRWMLLRKEDDAAIALYKSLGFHIAIGEIDQFLEYVSDYDGSSPLATFNQKVGNTFTGQVPTAGQVAQRPIKTFFLGGEPEWSDAYSIQVVRRRINSAVKNSIFNGRHVVVVGLPLSGKTTILKQVASEIAADRPVLYFDRISEPQVEKIITEHSDKSYKALIFVDNLLDSRNSIDRLVTEIGAQIVSAEQSNYFDSVNLKSLQSKLDVHSSSEVQKQDLQNIIDSIPKEIRRWRFENISIIEQDTGEVGLFESFRRHVFDEGLTRRFRAKLAEFETKDPQAFDVYIMACYVAACRTIVSFDMMYAFLPGQKKVYTDVYDIVKRVDSFLVEVDIEDPHQDHFSVRSSALARIALRECSHLAFSRVFERFHSSVPTRLIVDYPVFRRYAYDNDFARRAFPKVNDGKKFYERLVGSTDNAFDYQHGAIYLSKMKSFTDAFSWIDTAMSKSRNKVFSIRNTHARILFEANIDIVRSDSTNRTALEGIDESMTVLAACIKNDARRTYHLLRYSDQALQYGAVINDSKSSQWLLNAEENLQAMVKQAMISKSWESYNLRKYRNLLSEVQTTLNSRKR